MKEIEALLAIREMVKEHGPENNPDATSWFLESIARYMNGTGESLEKCLGLDSTRGTPSQRTIFMKGKRDEYLKAAFQLIDHEKPNTVRCDQLATEIKAMESRFYRKWKEQGGPPEPCSELRKNLYFAKNTGQPLSTKPRHLFRLIHGY